MTAPDPGRIRVGSKRNRTLTGTPNDSARAAPAVVQAAARGDADAIRVLWQEHRRWVASVLLAHKPREADLEDLLQDVAMAFVTKVAQLRDESALKPWLRTVALNTARAAGRKTSVRREAGTQLRLIRPTTSDEENTADSASRVDQREEARRLLELALRLPESYREPLLLRCLHSMSYRRIGEILDLPETTIETRIARGRRMLRELAAHQERDDRPIQIRGREPDAERVRDSEEPS